VQFATRPGAFSPASSLKTSCRALRLRNGLYIQRYAPSCGIAIPYGLLSD